MRLTTPSYLVGFSVLSGVSSTSAHVKRAACNADNCARAAVGTADNLQPSRLADCRAFMQCTVVPAPIISTSTVVITPPTITATRTNTVAVFTTQIMTVNAPDKRSPSAVGVTTAITSCRTAVPAYASTCGGTSRYSSACACAGVTRGFTTGTASTTTATITVTGPAPMQTVDVYGTNVVVQTFTELVTPSTSSATSTSSSSSTSSLTTSSASVPTTFIIRYGAFNPSRPGYGYGKYLFLDDSNNLRTASFPRDVPGYSSAPPLFRRSGSTLLSADHKLKAVTSPGPGHSVDVAFQSVVSTGGPEEVGQITLDCTLGAYEQAARAYPLTCAAEGYQRLWYDEPYFVFAGNDRPGPEFAGPEMWWAEVVDGAD